MLAKDQATGAYTSCYQQGEAEPPRGVKYKDDGKGKQGANHGTGRCRMRTDAYPVVDEGANNLKNECSCQNADHHVWHVHFGEQEEATSVAENENDVGNGAHFASAELPAMQAVEPSEGVNGEEGKYYRKQIDDGQDE